MNKLYASMSVYKRALQILDFNRRSFNLIELTSSVMGVTDATFITTLASACRQAVQAIVDMASKPFDDAVVSNLFSCQMEMNSACAAFERTPDETSCDARRTLDLQALDGAVETIFRCVVACQSLPCHLREMPRPLVVLDLAIFSIIYNAVKLFDSSFAVPEDTHVLTGKMPTSEIVSFTKLDTQKYFNDEEREEIRQREEAKKRAEQEAAEKARRMKLLEQNRDDLLNMLELNEDERMDLLSTGALAGEFDWYAAHVGIDYVLESLVPEEKRRKAFLEMGLDLEEGEVFCADGTVCPNDLYHAACVISAMNSGSSDTYRFILSETRARCEKGDTDPLPVSTLITYSKVD